MLKPKTTIDEMIKLLESKNIKFKLISKKEAKDYLIKNNNYYNITSYKKNFVKYLMGVNKGKYLNLDFAYLKDLGIIDFRLRMILFKIINSIEHYLKLRILKYIELINEENGYDTVNEFLNEDYQNLQKIHNSIKRKISSIEYKNICDKYLNDDKLSNIPIWEFLEIITFGELINFYEFFIKKYHISGDIKYVYILRKIKKLRNAVAHNDNILDRDDFYSYKVLDLPYGQQFVFVETELMSQYEQHQNAPSACDLISEITSDPEWETCSDCGTYQNSFHSCTRKARRL